MLTELARAASEEGTQEQAGAWGRERHRCPKLGARPSEDLQRMSRTPQYSAGLLGRLGAKLGKEVDVRMTCFTSQTINKKT